MRKWLTGVVLLALCQIGAAQLLSESSTGSIFPPPGRVSHDNNGGPAQEDSITAVWPPGHDVGATLILAPVWTIDSGTVVTPRATVYNFGTRTDTFPVTFRIGSVYDQTVTGITLTPGQYDTVDFPTWVAELGIYIVVAYTDLAGDENRANDTMMNKLLVISPPGHDVGATMILAPIGTIDSGTVVTPRSVVHNFGTETDTFPATFRIGGVYDQTVTGITLIPGQYDTVDFPNWVAQPVGVHNTISFTDLTGDERRSNDTVRSTVRIQYLPHHDVGAMMIIAPVGTIDSGTVVTPQVTVYNFGNRSEVFPVTFRIGSAYDQTVTGITLTPGQYDTVDFPTWVAELGLYVMVAYTDLTGDENRANDTVMNKLLVISPPRHDVGATMILAPVGTIDSGTVTTPQAVVHNYGNQNEVFPVTFRIGSVYDQTVTGITLIPGQYDTVDFPTWVAEPVGGYGTMAFTYLAGDEHPENDTVTNEFVVVYPPHHDVGATMILAPIGTIDSGTVVTPQAVVYNYGNQNEVFPVTFRIGSVYDQTVTSITLTPGQYDTVDFPNWVAEPVGSYRTMSFTDLSNDENRLNDTVYSRDSIYIVHPPHHDVGATMILAPVGTIDSGTVVTPQAVVYNFGTRNETFPVTFRIGSVYDQTVSDITLLPGQTDTIDFPNWIAQPIGTHNTVSFTDLSGDENRSNDTVRSTVTVQYPSRHDVGATTILAPLGTLDSGTVVIPRSVVHNYGTRDETFPVTFRIGSVYDQTVSGVTLTPGQTDTVDFPNWIAQPVGMHNTISFTDLTGDMRRANDTVRSTVRIQYPPRHDVGATMIIAPVGTLDSGTVVTPRIVVYNFGTRDEVFPATFRIGSVYDQTVSGLVLDPGQTDTVDFPDWIAEPVGTHNTVGFTNLAGDERRSNDTVRSTVTVQYPARHDVGATMILAPVGGIDSGTVVTPRAVVYNFGTRNETFPVVFRIGSVYDQTVSGITLTPGQTDTIDFPDWIAQPIGTHNTVSFSDLTGDQNRFNDTVRSAVTVQYPPRHDVGATIILAPIGTLDSGTVVTPRSAVYNFGTRNETFPVTFRIGAAYNQTVSGITLTPGQTDTVDFPDWIAEPVGDYLTMSFTDLAGDENRSNDTVYGADTLHVIHPERHDVGATAILAPVGTLDSGTVVTPRSVVHNFGTRNETFPVTFRIGEVYDQTVSGIYLTPGQTDTVAFPDWIARPVGDYVTMTFTDLAGDENRSNDTVFGADAVHVLYPERHDVGAQSILAPLGTLDSGTVATPRAVVHNYGTRDESFPAVFRIGSVYDQTVAGIVLSPGQTDTVDFPDWVAQPIGTYAVLCFSDLSGDQDRSNDTARGAGGIDSVRVVPPARYDVGTPAILAPSGTIDAGTVVTPQAVVYNYGTRGATFPVTFLIGSVYTQTVNRTLTPGQTDTVSFPTWTGQLGDQATLCFTGLEGDIEPANDTAHGNVSVIALTDVGTEAILAPIGTIELREGQRQTPVSPRARIANYGPRSETGFQVKFRIDKVDVGAETTYQSTAYEQTITVNTPLEPGAVQEIAFPDLYLRLGHYVASCTTMLADDRVAANDKASAACAVMSQIAADEDGKLGVIVYTRAGERVRRFDQDISRGDPRQVEWDGLNDRGQKAAPGIYIYLMRFEPVNGAPEQQDNKFLVTRTVSSYLLTWRPQ
jgi:hypothetical protein